MKLTNCALVSELPDGQFFILNLPVLQLVVLSRSYQQRHELLHRIKKVQYLAAAFFFFFLFRREFIDCFRIGRVLLQYPQFSIDFRQCVQLCRILATRGVRELRVLILGPNRNGTILKLHLSRCPSRQKCNVNP